MTFLRKRKIVNYSDIKRICKKKQTVKYNKLIQHGLEDVDEVDEANKSEPLNLFLENDYEDYENEDDNDGNDDNEDENDGNDENDSRLSKRTQYP